MTTGGPALLVALLLAYGKSIPTLKPGRPPRLPALSDRRQSDAQDAAALAEQAKTHDDLQPLQAGTRSTRPRTGSARTGPARLHAWLRTHGTRSAAAVAKPPSTPPCSPWPGATSTSPRPFPVAAPPISPTPTQTTRLAALRTDVPSQTAQDADRTGGG